jgi:tetratricopeptide (TPR) repeat protein
MAIGPVPDKLLSPPQRAWVWWTGVGVLLLVVGGAGLGLWFARRGAPVERPSDDPRVTYTGPYRNIHPDIAFVGDDACTSCHKDQATTYRRHPMANTLAPIAREAAAHPLDKAHNNPFTKYASLFHIDVQGERVFHRQTRLDAADKPIYELTHEVNYVIGSGNHGQSYLTEHDGYLFQTPISWYSQKQIWDISPGFPASHLSGRPVPAGCMNCHANRPQADDDSVNRYHTPVFAAGHGIGCERCHGPGELHVQSTDKLDIVNPRRLEWRLREAVCEQCHLEGWTRVVRGGRRLGDFRPGLPMEQFWTVTVHAGSADARKAVSHVEHMYQSKCFRGGSDENKMGCISCHDPHVKVAPQERAAHYRDRCLRCHQEHGCSLAKTERLQRQADDSCIACHMPRFNASDVAHTASTDHRIPRRPDTAGEALPAEFPNLAIASFYRDRLPSGDPSLDRDWGVALVEIADNNDLPVGPATRRALALLGPALGRDRDDIKALEALAAALRLQNRLQEALAAYEAVLKQRPAREVILAEAALLCEQLHQIDAAVSYWHRAVNANPWASSYRAHFASLLADRGRWDDAREQAEAWRRLEPGSVNARRLLIRLLLRAGRKNEAKAEFAIVEAFNPPDLAELRAWFAK